MTNQLHDPSSQPVLVTGATGYVGSRLAPALLELGYPVRVLVRSRKRIEQQQWSADVEVVEGDLTDPRVAAAALDGTHSAYYLVHSMDAGADFAEIDRRMAAGFVAGAKGLKHVIYLGGLMPSQAESAVSAHLSSRSEVGQILMQSLPVTEFRAGPIIGIGSASFEMVRHLTDKLPIMVAPRWISNLIQCIGIGDMLQYLTGALTTGPVGIVEVGSDRITFRQMMQT